ncbi:Hypothetical predicted protein [Octopus vulgaris]|uniref:Uncharacterized protein n=1 Tax=Octopus vulgaris TaxID=6645 RepID=A0AA36FGV2_OCTVU|nr:Hypothetical predicted protein [Octopus vulgaris]
MLDKADSSRPERRSALIAHELSRLNIDIAALSEVCFADESGLKERDAGYTLFWSGKPSSEKRINIYATRCYEVFAVKDITYE